VCGSVFSSNSQRWQGWPLLWLSRIMQELFKMHNTHNYVTVAKRTDLNTASN